jgi:hypothetical protein
VDLQTKRNQSRLRERRIIRVLLAGIVVAILGGLCLRSRAYYVVEFHGSSSVLWHDNEAYIFVPKCVSGAEVTRYQLLKQSILGAFWYALPPESLHEDLWIFHVRGSKREEYCIADFGNGGGPFPWKGGVYFDRGGDAKDWPYVWHWTGTNMLRLSKNEALNIINSFPSNGVPHSVSEQTKREGWKEDSLNFYYGKDTSVKVELTSTHLTVITSQSEGDEKVVLVGRTAFGVSETLSQVHRGYRKVSRSEYLKLKRQAKGDAAQ